MFDITDTESTSSGLITLIEANIMSVDINMFTVSQPRLPTPTPFDGSSPPFQEWASELRTFLDINGFQYIIQMDVAFKEDAPIHLHHLCSGTDPGTAAQDGITAGRAGIKELQDELADPNHLRDDADINNDISVLEADILVHQTNFDDELSKVKKASDYLSYILVHSTMTGSEPNHYIRRLHQSENGFESWRLLRLRYSGGHRLGTYSLLQNTLAPHWTEQHQHHQFRTWMEDIARYESESGMVNDDHLKIATVMNHDNLFSNSYIQQASKPGANNMVQQDDINVIRRKGKGKGKGKSKGKGKPSTSFPKGKGKGKHQQQQGQYNSKGKGKNNNKNYWSNNSNNYSDNNWSSQGQTSWNNNNNYYYYYYYYSKGKAKGRGDKGKGKI